MSRAGGAVTARPTGQRAVSRATTPRLPVLMLVAVAAIWGVTWPVGHELAAEAPLFSTMALRYALAVPLLFGWLALREGVRLPPRGAWGPLAAMALTSVVAYQVCFMYGVRYTAASDASLIIASGPVITALLSVALLAYRLERRSVAGLAAGFAGVAFIAWASPNSAIALRDRLLGDALVLGAAAAYALYTVLLRRYLLCGGTLSPLAVLAWVSLLGWLALLPLAIAEQPWEFVWTADHALFLLYLSVLSTVVGYLFYALGVARLGAPRAASFINLVPVFGVLSSWLWLDEPLGWAHAVSFVLVYAGVRLVNAQPPEGTGESVKDR